MKGIIKKWKGTDGYGFVLIEGERQIFFHISDWLHQTRPTEGEMVEFEIGPSRKPPYIDQAHNVRRYPQTLSQTVAALNTDTGVKS